MEQRAGRPDQAVPEPGAPAVVVVLVTCNAGPWLEECLASVAAQDYPNLSVLVLDAASGQDPTPRVAASLPGAFIRRLPENLGFAAAANEVLSVVEGASHFVFLHDDAAPAPDAIRLMVEEAYRSNAGVVCPKLVSWDDELRLLAVGMSADKAGVPIPFGRGELDQEQHDAVRDVFVAPGGMTLVRADLFATLGGFDAAIVLFGEDLDLSWRAQVLGARVVVAPAARVRHLEATAAGLRALHFGASDGDLTARARPLVVRHRLRTVLKAYGPLHLVRVVPQVVVLGAIEAAYAVLAGRRSVAAAVIAGWRWNLARIGELRRARRSTQRQRLIGDGEVRQLQTRGSTRLTTFLRTQLAVDEAVHTVGAAGRGMAGALRQGGLRLTAAVWVSIALMVVLGSRDLILDDLPVIGDLLPFPDPAVLLRHFVSGWRASGLGSESPAPPGFALIGAAGLLVGGAMGVLRQLLVLGCLPVGIVGAHRLAAPLGSWRARLLCVALYATIPLPYDALAGGRWPGVLAYAAMPWIIRRLLRATGEAPFAGAGALREQVVPAALLVGAIGALAPGIALMTALCGLGLFAGSLLVGTVRSGVRAAVVAIAASGGAAVLWFPWTLELALPSVGWTGLLGAGPAAHAGPGFGEVLQLGRDEGFAGWALLVAAALPLVIGRGWRFEWAARMWALAVTCCLVAWAAGRGWLGISPPNQDLLLLPAATGLVLAAVLGLAAFENDLPGYRFGWRQMAAITAAVAAAIAAVPTIGSALGGRWDTPRHGVAETLTWMPERRADGAFRVLWVGSPAVLPLSGWRIDDEVSYGTSRGGPPDATVLWPASDTDATGLIADALDVVRAEQTTRLGHLLAPMAVRYVVVPERDGAARDEGTRHPIPADLRAGLRSQIDLRLVQSDDRLTVFENVAWAPGRSILPREAVEASRQVGAGAASRAELAGAERVLTREQPPSSFSGQVPDNSEVFVSEASSSRWQLRSAGDGVARRKAFGWANAFSVDEGGPANLSFRTPLARYAALGLQLALWILAVREVVRSLIRRARTAYP